LLFKRRGIVKPAIRIAHIEIFCQKQHYFFG
jgi:hypothetical protein